MRESLPVPVNHAFHIFLGHGFPFLWDVDAFLEALEADFVLVFDFDLVDTVNEDVAFAILIRVVDELWLANGLHVLLADLIGPFAFLWDVFA